MRLCYYCFIVVISIQIFNLYAIVPIDSIVFGDSINGFDVDELDPYHNIFSTKEDEGDDELNFQRKYIINIFRGFYQEGKNLLSYCENNFEVDYPSLAMREQAKSSVIANLQYLGLNSSMRALAFYSKKLGVSDSGFNNIAENLVGNYCAPNISFISKKNLKKWFNVLYTNASQINLYRNDIFQMERLELGSDCQSCLEQEFDYAVKLFRSFCSWNGKNTKLRFLAPLISNPVIYSHLVRVISGLSLDWRKDSAIIKRKINNHKINCENFICRITDSLSFQKQFPRSLGGKDIEDDLKRLYCSDFKKAKLNIRFESDIIKNWSKEMNNDDYNYQISLLISYLTKVPDFILRNKNNFDGEKVLEYIVGKTWDEWSLNQLNKFDRDLYYEEPLRIEVVDRRFYFEPMIFNFKVVLDINLGEIDRTNQIIGKVPVNFSVSLSKSFLKWIRIKWAVYSPTDKKVTHSREQLLDFMQKHIVDQVNSSRKRFLIPPWSEGLERLIAKEIIEQLVKYEGYEFNNNVKGFLKIPVQLNYGPFALKYIHYLYLSQEYSKKNNVNNLLSGSGQLRD